MAGRAHRDAVAEFLGWLRSSVACITPATLVVPTGGWDRYAADPHLITFRDDPGELRTPDGRLGFALRHGYRIAQRDDGLWHTSTAYYFYGLLDGGGREIISFQWHPTGRHPHPDPHAQLGSAGAGRSELVGAHIPTRRITVERVIEFAIESFQVVPTREDWAEVLERNRRRHEAERSWG